MKLEDFSKKVWRRELKRQLEINDIFMPKIIKPKLKWYQKILQFLHIKNYYIIEFPKINNITFTGNPVVERDVKNENK